MCKRITLLILLIASISLRGQENIMIYYEGESFLIPYIQKELRELKCKKEEILFEKVTDLNAINRSLVNESNIRKLLDYYSNDYEKGIQITDETILSNDILSNSLVNYEYLLSIVINKLQDLIEYQFILYKRLNSANSSLGIPRLNLLEPTSTENFFIDPRDANYQKVIKTHIRKLFPICNDIPTFNLLVNKQIYDSTLNFGLNDSILLEVVNLRDYDDNLQDLKIKWDLSYETSNLESKIKAEDLITGDTSKVIKYQFGELGVYNFKVLVEDKIGRSLPQSAEIKIYKRPELSLTSSEKTVYVHVSPFNFKPYYGKRNIRYRYKINRQPAEYNIITNLNEKYISESLQDSVIIERNKHFQSFVINFPLKVYDRKNKNQVSVYVIDNKGLSSNELFFNPRLRLRSPFNFRFSQGFHKLSYKSPTNKDKSIYAHNNVYRINEFTATLEFPGLGLGSTIRGNNDKLNFYFDDFTFKVFNDYFIYIHQPFNIRTKKVKNNIRVNLVLEATHMRYFSPSKTPTNLLFWGTGIDIEFRIFNVRGLPLSLIFSRNKSSRKEIQGLKFTLDSYTLGISYNILGE